MNEIDQFALEVQRQIIENRKKIEALPDFEKRKSRPLGSNGIPSL